MSERPEARPRRLAARCSLALGVQVQASGLPAVHCQALNVSAGGMFVSSDTPSELNGDLTITICLPDGRTADLHARAVHVLSAQVARSLAARPGVGVKFHRLDTQSASFVHALVEWARARAPKAALVRIKPRVDVSVIEHEPMLRFLLGYVDGTRDVEALAQELALEADTIERMLGELTRHGLIELVASVPRDSVRPPARATTASVRPSAPPRRSALPARPQSADVTAAAEAARAAAASCVRPSQAPAASTRPGISQPPAAPPSTARGASARPSRGPSALPRSAGPSQPPAASSGRPSARPDAGSVAPLGAAAQILAQAEAAFQAGQAAEACRHLQLLSAMTFHDLRVQQRARELKQQAQRAAAVDFEKQAANEERLERWEQAAKSWLRVAEGRPQDGMALQRAALAQLQAGIELRTVMETAKRAVQVAPNDAQAHRILARVYAAANMQASADRAHEAARRCSARSDASDDSTPTGLLKRLLGRDGA